MKFVRQSLTPLLVKRSKTGETPTGVAHQAHEEMKMPQFFKVTVQRDYLLHESGDITVAANTETEAIERVKQQIAEDEDDEAIDYTDVDGGVVKDSYQFSAHKSGNA